MNLDIKKGDIAINPDGTIAIANPDLKMKIEALAGDPNKMLDDNGNCSGCNGSCGMDELLTVLKERPQDLIAVLKTK